MKREAVQLEMCDADTTGKSFPTFLMWDREEPLTEESFVNTTDAHREPPRYNSDCSLYFDPVIFQGAQSGISGLFYFDK